jgi:lambda family phage tail tape measure protein
VDAIGGLGELADTVGVSTDALQAFQFAATQVGLSSGDLERGLTILTRRIAEAAIDGGNAEEAFRKVGVAFLDASGNARATEAVLADVADRIAAVESPAERARIATEIFGDRFGQKLIPFLAQGRQKLEELIAEALRYGLIVDSELIAKSDQASDKIAVLGDAFGRLARRLAAQVAPILTSVANTIERVIFGAPISEQISRLEQQRASILAQLEPARQEGGYNIEDPLTGQVTRMLPSALEAQLQEIDQRLQALRQQSQQYQERASEILEGRTRTGANEAELRRQRTAEAIARLRETFDARLRIEREFQEQLELIQRGIRDRSIDEAGAAELTAQATRRREEALKKLALSSRTAADAEERRIDALRRQLELASLVDERERFVAERVAGLTGVQRAEAERLANTLFDLQQARREESQALSEVARLYDETRTPIERYIEALERLGELRPLLEVRFGVEGASEIISRRAEALVDILNKAENQAGKTNDVARQLGFTFESAFEDAILRGRKLSEVLQGIATDIARIFIRRTITEPIANWFGGLFGGIFGSAKGNVFEQGDLVPFARGGIVDRPTIFPFARGIGLMGEAGPEAIMPLARDSQGRLGVRASGVSPVINQTINVNVSGGGVSDVVEQQRLAREIGRLTRAGVIAAIQEQQRAGGLLKPSPQMV